MAQTVLVNYSCSAAGGGVGVFQLSVTIPAVIGLNVPEPSGTNKNPGQSLDLVKANIYSNTAIDLTETMVTRNNQTVQLRTIVVR